LERRRLLELTAGLSLIGLLAVGCVLVLKPFLSSLVWAAILCHVFWPAYSRLETALAGRRTIAALLITLGISLILIAPLVLIGLSLGDSLSELKNSVERLLENGLPALPLWVGELPLIGDELLDRWRAVRSDPDVGTRVLLIIGSVREGAIGVASKVAQGSLDLTLSVLIAFFGFRGGERLAHEITVALTRLVGSRANEFVALAGRTVRGVVFGTIGTAMAQGTVGVIGYLIIGVPGALLFGLLTFLMGLIPFGPPLVWIPITLWLVFEQHYGQAVFMGLWGLLGISGIDNFIKPYLISVGSRLPFLLVFLGVLGGLAAFGFLGIFLGPVLLAVGHTLLKTWAQKLPDNQLVIEAISAPTADLAAAQPAYPTEDRSHP